MNKGVWITPDEKIAPTNQVIDLIEALAEEEEKSLKDLSKEKIISEYGELYFQMMRLNFLIYSTCKDILPKGIKEDVIKLAQKIDIK